MYPAKGMCYGEKFGTRGGKRMAGRPSWWPCGEEDMTPIMVGDVVWGYWTPYSLLLGKELRNASVTVKRP